MKLLNYTTEIEPSKTIGEIYSILAQGGAQAIMAEYDGAGGIEAVSFRIATSMGPTMYRLPANVPAALLVLNQLSRKSGKDRIPAKYFNNVAQARRVAWRIIKDWIEAQVAIHQLGQAKLEQVMLPFAVMSNGETFYHALTQRGTLSLDAPKDHEKEIEI